MKRTGHTAHRKNRQRSSTDHGKNASTFFSAAVQPKLAINQPNDHYEMEADAMADKVMNDSLPTNQSSSHSKVVIQRKCATCDEEEKNIQRKESGAAPATNANSSLNQILRSGGEPMDHSTRSFMEERFDSDFSDVRIHNDEMAQESSNNINALAYTHGNHIVFNKSQYNPSSQSGKRLLAHELTHVAQQRDGMKMIQRSMQVIKPDDKIPNPTGTGLVQTNGETVISYLNEICKDASPSISSGIVSIDPTFCTGTVKDASGNAVSKIQQSKTPAGCACACEMIQSPNAFKIVISDTATAGTRSDSLLLARTSGTGATITVPSPNGTVVETMSKSGKLEKAPSWLVFAHELCGHASFMNKGKSLDDFVGNASQGRGTHTATTNIENKIRKEHDIEARGTHRDPCCGAEADGVVAASGVKTCSDFLKTSKGQTMVQDPNTILFECKKWRDEYNQLNGTSFTLEDAVPEKTNEITPAEYRYDIFFNKDMPQSWFDPGSSFSVSVTNDGKDAFGEASRILELRTDIKKIQLEGYASSDKPKNDPDYNTRLVKNRVKLIKTELLKKGINSGLFTSFQPTIPGKTCVEMEAGSFNCSDTESSTKTDPRDRKVVIRFTKM
jgi:hypothetical protein